MTEIASYFAKIRFQIDKSEIKRIEAAFRSLEKKLKGSVGALAEETKAKQKSEDASKAKADALGKEAKATDKLAKSQDQLSKSTQKLNKAVSDKQASKNRSSFFTTAKNIGIKTGQGLQYRLGEQRLKAALEKAKKDAVVEGQTVKQIAKTIDKTKKEYKQLSDKQAGKNLSSFFASSRGIELKTGYGAQYRLGEQARAKSVQDEAKLAQMLQMQANRLKDIEKSKAKIKQIDDSDVFRNLQLRLASKQKSFSPLSERATEQNRKAFLESSRRLELVTGQGSEYRIGEQLAARKAAELKQAKELADAEAKLKKQALDKEREKREKDEKDSIKRLTKAHAEALADNRIFDADIKRRQQAEDKRRQAEQKLLERKERMDRQREERFRRAQSRNSRSNYLSAGGGSAAFMRYGVASLPLIGGMYGLASLNKANQELMSAEMANKATLGDQGQRSLDWLRNQANTIGFNYLDQLPIFTNFMASGTPLMGYDQSRDIFSSMTQFGMTRGATSDSMKRAMYAVSQMAAKGQVTTEELKSQLSEARGFGESRTIFAEAYQRLIGGNATGEEAASALIEAMGKGNVKSRDILPIVAQLMKEKAAGGIAAASKTSAAEQNRFANAMTDLTRVFGQSGGERGFANLFQGFTSNANASTSLVEGLARGFESVAASLERVLSLSESFKNAIEGNDSQVADWLGAEKVEQLKADWFAIKESIKDIFNMDSAGPSWLQRMTETIQTLINSIAELFRTLGGTKVVLSDIWEKHGGFGKPDGLANSVIEGGGYLLGAGFDAVRRLGANAIQTGVNMIPFASSSVAAPYANNLADMIRPTGKGADQQYWDTRYSELPAASKEMALDSIARGRYNNGQFTPATATNQNTFNMQFTITGGTEGTEDWFRHSFQNVLNETLPNYARSAQ